MPAAVDPITAALHAPRHPPPPGAATAPGTARRTGAARDDDDDDDDGDGEQRCAVGSLKTSSVPVQNAERRCAVCLWKNCGSLAVTPFLRLVFGVVL